MLLTLHTAAAQSLIIAGPNFIRFTATADSLALPGPQRVVIGVQGAEKLEFKFNGVAPAMAGGPNFIVVSPSSGVAPTQVFIALNPNVVPYLSSGSYALILGFALVGQSSAAGAGISVFLDLTGPLPPRIASVASAATLQSAISPGEVVSILGLNLSIPPTSAQYDAAGLYPTAIGTTPVFGKVGNTTVTFNGVPAPLLT